MQEELKKVEEKMQKSVSATGSELATIRAGRANPAVLDKILVDYYGVPTAINAMAAISVSEARVLVITPWDRNVLTEIEKAIQSSDVGINPTNDGTAIRLAFPQLTEERRVELSKEVRKMGEDGKVAIRNVRRDAMDKFKNMKKKNEMTEDDQKLAEDNVQKLTDKYIKEIDDLIADKEKEIMEV